MFLRYILLFSFISFFCVLNPRSLSSQIHTKSNIKLGIDVLIETGFESLKGQRVALLTNNTGRTKDGTLTAEIFAKQLSFKLTGIFTPEHGFYSTVAAGKHVSNSKLFGVKVFSLYGKNRKPSKALLENCDIVVVDLQDIGVRSYTFLSTLYNVLSACAEHNKSVMVLDRPNPIGGNVVDGNTVEEGKTSFVSIISVPYIHGCTFGELAYMMNNESWLGKDKYGDILYCNLSIVKMENWKRDMVWEETGLYWFPTSPYVPTPDAVRGIACTGIIGELGTISIGIGSSLPFQYIGSPSFKTDQVFQQLSTDDFGLKINPLVFSSPFGMYAKKNCNGFLLLFPHTQTLKPYSFAINTLLAIRKYHPKLFSKSKIRSRSKKMFAKVTGTDKIINGLFNNASDWQIKQWSRSGLEEFQALRTKYLIYK